MLLKIKGFPNKFAIDLRWLIATRDEIDYLKDREKLSYGFINNLQSKENSVYRSVVLTDSDYDKSISLAGIISEKYENIIFIHKTQNDNYWICIIKNHSIWNELNLADKTAGDYICNKETLLKILEFAREDFEKEGIPAEEISYVSTQAEEAFPEMKCMRLADILENSKTYYAKYKILWLQSYKKRIKRLVIIGIALVITISGVVYLYSSQNESAQKRAHAIEVEMEKQKQKQEREKYFNDIKNIIYRNQIRHGVQHMLQMLNTLSPQSSGWDITQITYRASNPYRLEISLKRNPYGDILSFKKAYAETQVQENIQNDNNSGTKTLDLTKNTLGNSITMPAPTTDELDTILTILSGAESNQRYRLIAIGQKLALPLQTSGIESSSYGVIKSSYTISGVGLWNLRKLTFLFADFPTMTIDNITMNINNQKVTWNITGEIYG